MEHISKSLERILQEIKPTTKEQIDNLNNNKNDK